MTYQVPQHDISNNRRDTGEFLYPSHFPFEECIESEIIELCKGYEHIIIDDSQVTALREASKNTLTFGDAFEIVLHNQLRGYVGMIDPSREYSLGTFETKGYEVSLDESEKNAYDVLNTVKQKKVFTSLYSKVNQQTFYFLDY